MPRLFQYAMATLLLASPVLTAAAGFDYNYIEGGYLNESPSRGSSLSGIFVDGSYALQPNWHLGASYSTANCCGVTDNRFGASLGYNAPINGKLDFVADIGFIGQNVTGNGTHTGWALDGGLRAWLAPQFELDGLVSHSEIRGTTENTLAVRGLYSLNRNWRLFAGFSNNSDENDFILGVRYAF